MNSLLKLKRLQEYRKRISFFQMIDLLTVEENSLMVGVSGKIGFAYKIEGVDFLLFEDEKTAGVLQEFRKLLNQLPEGVTLAFLRRRRKVNPGEMKFPGNEIPLAREIFSSKLDSFKNQRVLKKELFLFVSVPCDLKSKEAREAKEKLLRSVESLIVKTLESLGAAIQKLNQTEVIEEYFKKLNPLLSLLVPSKEVLHEEIRQTPQFETLRSRLLLHPPKVSDEAIYLDGFYHAFINLRMLPGEAWAGMTKTFEQALPDESEWLLAIRKPDQEKQSSKMSLRANLAHASAFFRFREDHVAQEKANQHEAFLHEMAVKNESIFEISLSVCIRDESLEGLRKKKELALKAFPKLGGLGIYDHFEHDVLFLTHLALQGEENPVKFPVLTDSLVQFLPLVCEWKGSKQGEIILKTYQDEILSLDLFDSILPAKHALMIGSTGSGKSFSANFLLMHFLIANPNHHVVIVDVGGSYRKLAEVFGGSYLEIDCSEKYALNPFFEKKRLFSNSGEFDSDLLAFLTTLVEKMVTEREKLTSGDLRIIEQAILEAYRTVPENDAPLLEDVRNVLRNYSLGDEEDRQRAYHFSKNLGIWTEGRFGVLLNRRGTLSLHDRLLVFDLGKLSAHPELQSIIFFVIRSALSRKLDDLALKKMVVIDEGWRFFNDEIGSRLVEELYRTARKTNSLILSISQSPEDFLESKAATAILANSYVKYILKLQKGHKLLSRFDLNPNEIRACSELEISPRVFSELFIKFFNRSVIAKIEPSSLEYWIATTDPDDFLLEEDMKKKNPGLAYFEILKKLSEECPFGTSKKKG